MFPEISLNILDIAQNSIKAQADLIEITLDKSSDDDTLTVIIKDNGCGMSKDETSQVIDPFYTTRTTRKVGLGIPFFRSAALMTGGIFTIDSVPLSGTTVTAVFHTLHIDCIPLGDITNTILILITMNEAIDFIYTYSTSNNSFTLDTRELRHILGNIPLSNPEVKEFLSSYLNEHMNAMDK